MESSIRKKYYNRSGENEAGMHLILGIMKTTFREYLDGLENNKEFLQELMKDLTEEGISRKTDKIFSYDTEMDKLKEKALQNL